MHSPSAGRVSAALITLLMVWAGPIVAEPIREMKSRYPEFDIGSTAPVEVAAAVEAVIDQFAAKMSSREWYTATELWDRDEPAPYLLLSHQADWLIGWEQLDGYFSKKPVAPVKALPDESPAGMRQMELRHYEYRSEIELQAMLYSVHDVRVNRIDDDLATAVWYVDFQYKPYFMPAKGETFKANAMFRNTPDGWKFIHYSENPMSAIMYFERLYRQQVTPEFLDMISSKKNKGAAGRSGG